MTDIDASAPGLGTPPFVQAGAALSTSDTLGADWQEPDDGSNDFDETTQGEVVFTDLKDTDVSLMSDTVVEPAYRLHQHYVSAEVLPHVSQAIERFLSIVQETVEKGGDYPYDPVAWLSYYLKTGQLPRLKRKVLYKAGLPLRDRLVHAVLADSYKAGHFLQYPNSRRMVAYGEFRARMAGRDDDRLVFYGLRGLVEEFLLKPWTMSDVENAAVFFATHGAQFASFAFPRELFEKFVTENNGYFPIKVEALREGSVVYVHTPVYQLTAVNEYSALITFLETLLTMVWYPSTVATQSRRLRDSIQDAFDESVENSAETRALIDTRVIDMGMASTSGVDQTVIGGCAHLLSFTASHNAPSAYHAQFALNNGLPVATAAIAPPTDETYVKPKRVKFTDAAAVVQTLRDVETVATAGTEDSAGLPLVTNSKGYKVLPQELRIDGCAVVDVDTVLQQVMAAGFSVQTLSFGMTSALLQMVNRDTMSFATKLSFIEDDAGARDVMKRPRTDGGKISLPGCMQVLRDHDGVPMVSPADTYAPSDPRNLLRVVYDNGPITFYWDDFSTVKARVADEWERLAPRGDPLSNELVAKIEAQLYPKQQ
eukprot:TRINITY_DN1700_c0_g1_i1.p1 TRINITY_DN1700_c0_g1~~TRINITY_DN1700_c0_g1_i1.p1  ORF type:complete len:610 (-),score=143.71 TRINITY_DN1700_c0_g1_i1:665-2452(-)